MAFGAAAGAAGTTALNAASYLDMAVRGRPTSDTPEHTVERLGEIAQVQIPGEGEMRDNQVAGHGPLTGLVAGVGSGVLLALARAAGWRPGPGVEVGVATGLALIGRPHDGIGRHRSADLAGVGTGERRRPAPCVRRIDRCGLRNLADD